LRILTHRVHSVELLRRRWSRDHLVGTDQVHDGELELATEDAKSAVSVWRADLRELRGERFGFPDGFVEKPSEPRTDGREVLNLVKKLFASIIHVANGSHRW
jgi:hypothetical protein